MYIKTNSIFTITHHLSPPTHLPPPHLTPHLLPDEVDVVPAEDLLVAEEDAAVYPGTLEVVVGLAVAAAAAHCRTRLTTQITPLRRGGGGVREGRGGGGEGGVREGRGRGEGREGRGRGEGGKGEG